MIVGAEAFSSMEISALSRCGHVVGRLSVDVAADPPVDQRGLRPRLRAHKTSCRSCKKRVQAYAVALLRLISRKPHFGCWFARVPTTALWTPAYRSRMRLWIVGLMNYDLRHCDSPGPGQHARTRLPLWDARASAGTVGASIAAPMAADPARRSVRRSSMHVHMAVSPLRVAVYDDYHLR